VWFNYQRTTCGGSLDTTVKVMGDQLLSTDYTLDYTLFTVANFEQLGQFSYLGLDNSEPSYGTSIYIPQHGAGNPKELAIESDQNGSGMCQIDIASTNGRGANTDTGYFCDTIGGSSGSPVLTSESHKVIALHHFGGCENQGVKISKIWPQVAPFF
ncbi:trypsin-like serine peptidase, partial [Vibrio anguillarum]